VTRSALPEVSEARARQIAERLFDLLPGLYRTKDILFREAEAPRPLEGFLQVLAYELARLAEAIEAHDDDHFVERASPEALALLAELYGIELLGTDVRINRALLARGVGWRRRKGTPATLAEMLSITTGWAVDVHEGFPSVMITQDARHVVPSRGLITDLSDPIVLADPIARRARAAAGVKGLALAPGETVDDARRRIGRVDAGRPVVSPRTPDFRGWARPEAVLVRAAQLCPVELEDVPVNVTDEADGRRVIALDPLGRETPLVWLEPVEAPELLGGLTSAHEPDDDAAAAPRTAAAMLTPTALAADPGAVEAAGAIEICVAGVPIVGPPRVAGTSDDLAYAPLGDSPLLRFADPSRPGPGDAFHLELFAVRSTEGDVDQAGDPPVDRLLAHAEARPGETGVVDATADARAEVANAVVALRITRVRGQGSAWSAGAWAPIAAHEGAPLGNVAVIGAPGSRRALRAESNGAALRLASLELDVPGAAWTSIALPVPLPPAPGVALAAAGDDLILALPDGDRVALHRVRLAPAVQVERLDAGLTARPPWRDSPSLLVDGDRLYLHGGATNGAPAADLWSFSLTAPAWTPHLVRNRQARAGATLVKQWGRLLLLGGQSSAGALDPAVYEVDLGARRPTWTALAPLPAAAGAPGFAIARATASGVEAVVWADRTRPFTASLASRDGAWSVDHAIASGAPNPPAQGDAAFAGSDLLVLGAPPLPPAEIVFTIDGRSRLAFLPALDLAPGATQLFVVGADGSTRRRFPAVDEARARPPYAGDARRAAGAFRHAVPGRLSSNHFVLRQRAYGSWEAPHLVTEVREDVVGIDPRTGRAVLPPSAPKGAVTASYRVGRGAHLGAGAMPQGRRLPSFWEEPGAPAPTPPDLSPERASISAYVDPTRAGLSRRRRGSTVAIFGTVEAALASARGEDHPIVGVLGAPRLAPARLAASGARGLSLHAIDPQHAPLFAPPPAGEDGPSLAIFPELGGSEDTELWLAGLWLAGRLDLVMARGRADLRWCTLAGPGAVGLRIPGGAHEGAPRTIVEPEIEIRLYGCVVGAIELPSWARLVAAGCTFDGGDDGRAIRAAGAQVHLRHCTVRGSTEAGKLFASSCAFSGPVRVARPEEGYLRYSVVAPESSAARPILHASIEHPLSFASIRPTDPRYLVLAENNGLAVLAAGELGRVPGAHGERTDSLRELEARTRQHLPVGMIPVHLDRATNDLTRMGRSFP
jgi:hypothetical protein